MNQNEQKSQISQFTTKAGVQQNQCVTFYDMYQSNQDNDQKDFQYIQRTPDQSIKYFFTLNNKTMHQLNPNQSKQSISNMPIICSYADMQFKISPEIQKQFCSLLNKENITFGYRRITDKQRQILFNHLKDNVYSEVKQEQISTITAMLTLYSWVITDCTSKQDNVLIFTPTYYRFLYTLQVQGRNIIQYKMKTRQTQNGFQFYIDFQQLQSIFQKHQIKLVVWANPHNPTCKVWKYQDLQKLTKIVIKSQSLIFTDDIFCQFIQNPKQYTSLLKFKQIHQQLIWAGSFGKAFNCSSNSFAYTIIPNQKIRNQLLNYINKLFMFPKFADVQLMRSCFQVGQNWKRRCIKYIQSNYERKMNLKLSTLDSGFLPIIDFSHYGWKNSQIKSKLESQNIFPTYLDNCYVNSQTEQISMVRINLALNRLVLMQMINRLQKLVKI